jgi:hypothetical protein
MKRITDEVLFKMHKNSQGTGSFYGIDPPNIDGASSRLAKIAWNHKEAIAKAAKHALPLLGPEGMAAARAITAVQKVAHKAEKLADSHPGVMDAAHHMKEAVQHSK